MQRIAFSCVAIALIGLGVCTVVWPAWVILKSRDEGDNRPLSSGQILATRVAALGMILCGVYLLYALLTGMPGADFLTP